MIKKGLILCILTFLISSLMIEFVYYGDKLVYEFEYTEKVETLPISEINTYDYHSRDGVFLTFRYKDSERGREYSCSPIFTNERSYKVGDLVEVVTRNGCPESLLSSTSRKRQRTFIERVTDVGYDSGMVIHIIITSILILAFGLPNYRMIPKEIERRKKFFITNTFIHAVITVLVCIYLILSESCHNSWDGLGYAFISILLYFIGAIELLISWIVNSIILRKKLIRNDEN